MRMQSFFAILLLLPLTGCGKDDFGTTPAAPSAPIDVTVTTPPITGVSSYISLGDSITAGYTLSDQASDYVSLTAAYNALPLKNVATGGDEACDVPTRQIFGNAIAPTLARPTFLTMLIGTNDVTFKGTGAPEATFNLCHQAALAWIAVPLESKVLATSPGVTSSGTTHLETSNNWNALTTDAPGSSVSFPIVLGQASPIYLWYRIIDGNVGAFTCGVDGTNAASLVTAPPSSIKTLNAETNSLALLRIPSKAPGAHAVTCTQTAGGAAGMGIVAVGSAPAASTAGLPRVLAGTIPKELNDINHNTVAAYTADIRANVALLAGDGLNIQVFDPYAYMTGTTNDMADALHPNVLGHKEVFKSLEDALK